MTLQIKTYSFEETYLPISQRLTIDEENDQIILNPETSIPFPATDGNILEVVVRYYVTHPRIKLTRSAAKALGVNTRDLSSAIHLLTGMHHDDFLRQYRLRTIIEVLTLTTISTTVVAKFFGYSSLHVLNQFLVDQTELTANEIRDKRDAATKQKRGSWYHADYLDMDDGATEVL